MFAARNILRKLSYFYTNTFVITTKKKSMLHKSKTAVWVVIACLIASGIAWQTRPHTPQGKHFQQDTTPKKEKVQEDETVINGDLERAMEEVKKAQENLERQLQKGGFEKMQKDLLRAQAQLNAREIHTEVEKAMKEIAMQKINLAEQMKNIDMQKIQAETQEAMQKINWKKMQQDMQQAQAELKNNIDYKKMERGMSRSMEETKKAMAHLNEIDMQKIQQQLERVQEGLRANEGQMQEDMERAGKEINENLHKDFRKEMEKAKEGVQKAAEELRSYKEMISEMQKDGLLKNDDTYNIQYKKGDLYIDGVKQTENITSKYRHYFKQENIRLKKSKEDDGKTIDL